mmetsp:Transcript_104655/g.301796  ORF Transcript_104655/g.301796 Transcript_104655/m.301796 type:complete len:111 (-) Transcript_104655:446-778(-)
MQERIDSLTALVARIVQETNMSIQPGLKRRRMDDIDLPQHPGVGNQMNANYVQELMQVRQYESNLLEALNRIPPSMRAGSGLGHQMRHDPTAYDGVHSVSWLLPADAVCA